MYEINSKSWVVLIATGLFLILGGVGSCMYVTPKYNVWRQEMEGKAEFAKAEQNRKIKIEEAKANLEAEKLNAQAEIERAKGAAEAIRIENGSITPAYIQYLWVRQQNANTNNKIIYIPTEAGLPVLEAGRVAKKEE
jgi:regulator of protease activity HflC (stomatin/prohibitin superfamily)